MMRRCIVALLLFAVGACASAPVVTVPTLAYAIPPVNPVRYSVADTTRVAVTGDRGRSLATTSGLTARAAVTMHVDSAGLLSSVRLESVEGMFAVGSEITTRVDSTSAPSGAALLRMGPQGVASTMHVPGLDAGLARFIGGETFFRQLFVRLPGGTIAPGGVWTDTLRLADDVGGVHSRTETIQSATLAGDTAVGDRVLRVILTRFTTSVEVSGIVDGLEVRQRLVGTGHATTLWDEAASVLYSRDETVASTGTMDLPAAGLRNVPVEAQTRRVVRLLP